MKAGNYDTTRGYSRIVIMKKAYQTNRLAWFYMTGNWPPNNMVVDHKNRIKTDDRWENLRLATKQQNVWNRQFERDLHTNVYRSGKNWRVQFQIEGKNLCHGSFNNYDDACKKANHLAKEYYGEFHKDANVSSC